MTTAVADPPVDTKAASAAAAAPSSAPAAGSPAGAGAGSGAGGAPAPASGEPAKGATPASTAPAAKPKSLLEKALDAEAKPADGKPAEPAKAEPAAKADDWTLEAPKDTTVAPDALKAVQDFAKAEGLSKAQAEKLLAREVASEASRAAAQKAQLDEVANTLAAQVEAHPELGGQHLAATLDSAKRAMVAIFSPEERKAIVASPLGNHPLLIKALAFAAKGIAEDRIHSAPTAADPVVDGAKLMYGSRAKR